MMELLSGDSSPCYSCNILYALCGWLYEQHSGTFPGCLRCVNHVSVRDYIPKQQGCTGDNALFVSAGAL